MQAEEIQTPLFSTSKALSLYGYDTFVKSSDHSELLPFFSETPDEIKSLIYQSWKNYEKIIEEGPRKQELPIERDFRHLEKFLKENKLIISDKVKEKLKDGHIIEVYANNHQQLHRSVNFFGLSSYSLEVLSFMPWDKLFHRSETDTNKLLGYANNVMESMIECLSPISASHFLTELKTQTKFKYNLEHIGMARSEDNGSVVGYITLITVRKTSHINMLH